MLHAEVTSSCIRDCDVYAMTNCRALMQSSIKTTNPLGVTFSDLSSAIERHQQTPH